MRWVYAVLLALIAWALYWPVGWLDGVWLPVVMTVLIAAFTTWASLDQRAKARVAALAIERGILPPSEPEGPRSESDIEAMRARIAHGIAALKRSRLGGKVGSAALHALPWYVIIGPPGAGKTTALQASVLDFVLAGEGESGGVRGVGGTRSCDWWFANEGIFLDTAGRYTTGVDDHEEWIAFLRLLKKHRGRCPINGMIVAVSIADLLAASDEQIELQGKRIRVRLDEIVTELRAQVPVYVIFTKMDLIAGFDEIFARLKKHERFTPWGATFRLSTDRSRPGALFETEFDLLLCRIHARALREIAKEQIPEARAKIYRFPLELAAIRSRAAALTETIFRPNPYQATPLFRGFYFTSGTQEGVPYDRVVQTMGRVLGVPPAPREPRLVNPKSYFLHDLFTNIVLADADLAASTTEETRQQRRVNVATAVAAAALSLELAVPATWSFVNNRRLLDSTLSLVRDAQDVRPGESLSESLSRLDPVLDRLRELDLYREDGPPVELASGMYQGESVYRPALVAYMGQLETAFLRPSARLLEERLRQASGAHSFDERLELKAYLMLGDALSNADADDLEWLIGRYVDLWFEAAQPIVDLPKRESKAAMVRHVRYYFAARRDGRVSPAPLDQALIAEVRGALANAPVGER